MYTHRTAKRLAHLTQLTTIQTQDSDDFARWSKTRCDRLITEYLLRSGLNETAGKFAEDANIQVSRKTDWDWRRFEREREREKRIFQLISMDLLSVSRKISRISLTLSYSPSRKKWKKHF